jgi:hypothetical protein
MKLKATLALLFAIAVCCHLHAQQADAYKGAVVYLELGGNSAPTIGLNIEHRIFRINQWYGNARIGYGTLRNHGVTRWSVPIGFTIFHGIKASHVEVGAGFTYGTGLHSSTVGSDTRVNEALYFVPSIAYRFQKSTGGFFLRAAYTPLFKLKEYSKQGSWFYDQRLNQYFGS